MWEWWHLGVLLFVSFLLSNALVLWIRKKRFERIAVKTEQLLATKPDGDNHPVTPVTILTGFLGSGKTTLLNRLLANPEGRKIAVIENEVGAISLDDKLLKGQDPKSVIVVLDNGCVCCTSSGTGSELEQTLDHLLKLAETATFDYVVIELTGLADPAPVVQTLFNSRTRRARYSLDGIVTVVDAKHIRGHLLGQGFGAKVLEAQTQIAYADRVLLNKIDLVSPDEIQRVEEAIHTIRPGVPITHCTRCDVPVDALLGIQAFSLDRIDGLAAEGKHDDDVDDDDGDGDGDGHGNGHGHGHGHSHPSSSKKKGRHTAGISSVCITTSRPVDLNAVQVWLRSVITSQWQNLLRVKGIIHVAGFDEQFVIHGVHSELEGGFEGSWPDTEPRQSTIVFIGKELNRKTLLAGLERCADGAVDTAVGDDEDEVEVEDEANAGHPAQPVPEAAPTAAASTSVRRRRRRD